MDPSEPTRVIDEETTGFPALVEPSSASTPDLDEGVALDRVRTRMLGLGDAPTQVGRYRIVGRVGQGGMGVVLAAHDDALDRPVAIKILRRELAANTAWRERFTREAQALARLSHPNVVQVYEVGSHDDKVFIAMELVEGTPLREWARERPRGWQEIVDVFIGAGAGLSAAHHAGLVHRDFKPDNVVVTPQGPGVYRARVLDFGVVRFEADSPRTATPSGPFATVASGTMTEAGTVMGTLAYMPPEQRRGETIDARADQYAFAVSLYELLYGVRPHGITGADRSTAASVPEHTEEPSLAAMRRERRVPAWLHAVVTKALAPDSARRWASMDELLRALQRPPRTRTVIALAATVGVLALVLGGRVAWGARETAMCERDAESLRAWWDDAAPTIEAGLLATDVAHAAQTWGVARPRIDAFVDGWSTARAEACRVERDGEAERAQAVRACLDQRRAALEALAEIWTTATTDDVAGVAPAAASLPPLASCSDPGLVLPADDAEQDARAQLFRADAARLAGRHAEAIAIAEHLAQEGAASDIRASAALLLADVANDERDFAKLEAHLRTAFVRAIEAGRNDLAGDAAARLAGHLGAKLYKYDEYAQWSEIARAAFTQARLPDSDPRVLGLLGAEASVVSSRGEAAHGVTLRRELLAGLVAAWGEEHPDTLDCRHALAVDLTLIDRFDEAIAEYREILRVREASLGADHPRLAGTLLNYGEVLFFTGDVDGAIAAHQRTYDLVVTNYGDRHPLAAAALEYLGVDHCGELRPDPATGITYLDRAVELERRNNGGGNFELARILDRRAVALVQLRRFADSERDARESLAIIERTVGPDHVAVSYPLQSLARALAFQGDTTAARPLFERAVALRAATHGAGSKEAVELQQELDRMCPQGPPNHHK